MPQLTQMPALLSSIQLLTVSTLLMACTSTSQQPGEDSSPESRDCAECPVMIELPPGDFLMGTAVADRLSDPRTGKPATNDSPQHSVTLAAAFAIGKYEVSGQEFAEFVSATGYQPEGPCMEFSPPESFTISDEVNWHDTWFPQTDSSPVVCVSFFDAQAYTNWLTSSTGQNYRLPTEAEWEYAARAGSTGPYHWGSDDASSCEFANIRSPGASTISKRQAASDRDDGFPCDDGFAHSSPVGSFSPNAFGLHDMQGNAWEWVADCNHKNYKDAPSDGSAWLDDKGCQFGIIRSGSFLNRVERSSTTVRAGRPREGRATNMGFRVVRSAAAVDSETIAAPVTWQPGSTGNSDSNDSGADLFSANCAACHVREDDFRGVYGKDQTSVEQTIKDGGNNIMSMPAFADRLSALQITRLAEYVRSQNNWD
jgi:formylglycine-generating enzyme required for sulfatase activity